MSFLKILTTIIILSLLIISCGEDSTSSHLESKINKSEIKSGFTEIDPEKSGVDFNNMLKDDPLSEKNVLSYQYYFNGAGVGIGDFNSDGLPDIFFAGNEVPNELYINKGDFKFEKLGSESGINTNKVWSSGVSVVDINLDGRDDIYVCQQGPHTPENRKNLFYINNGDLTFTESAAAMGLDDKNLSTQAAFLDYDKDGDLDCYVLNESKYVGVVLDAIYKDLKKEGKLREASGSLYENQGNMTFKDVTSKSGVMKYGYGLGVAVSDLNGDNWPDIYVANDYTVPDFMYINQKDGTFKESIKEFTKQTSYFAMGCDIADINNDGLVDIGVVDMASEDHFRDKTLMAGMDTDLFKYYFWDLEYQLQYMFNSLQLNNGNNTFSNIAAMAGVLKSDWSWATLFSDFNLDGHKDYFVSNGYRRYSRDNDFRNKMKEIRAQNNNTIPLSMRDEVYALMPEVKLKNKLYVNDGKLHFDDKSAEFSHPDLETYSYGTALADFDGDGDMDMIISNVDQPALLLKNNIREDSKRNFVKIYLDERNQAKKLGSKITIKTTNTTQLQEYNFVRGYESSMQEVLLFGIGDDTIIEQIEVLWPDGNIQVISNPEINTEHRIKYAKGSTFSSAPDSGSALLSSVDNSDLGISYKHTENFFDDFETEILLPQKQTYFGPALAITDFNGDGLEDFFTGGATGQSAAMQIQKTDGSFAEWIPEAFGYDIMSEDTDATFVDPNQDGNMDLIVLSGGSGDMVGQEPLLQDRFYASNGSDFGKISNVLPLSNTASHAIIKYNIDDDPESELLILGAAIPGKYPASEKHMLLDYQNNAYVNVIEDVMPGLNSLPGLTRSATYTDLTGDGVAELITAGEWQNIQVYQRGAQGKYVNKSSQWKTNSKSGWWRSIKAADLDGDGDNDLVVGNVGVNFKQKASPDHPLYLFSNDYDDNGTLDCVLAKDYNGKIVPARGKECSTEQMPFISERYKTYKDFASASLVDILGEEKIDDGIQLQATDFSSYVLWNDGGKFNYEKLPPLAQSSPVNDILIQDFDADGSLDLFLVGNEYNTEYETPRLDAGRGFVLLNRGDKKFEVLSVKESGVYNPEDARKIKKLKQQDNDLIIIANNNEKLGLYRFNKNLGQK